MVPTFEYNLKKKVSSHPKAYHPPTARRGVQGKILKISSLKNCNRILQTTINVGLHIDVLVKVVPYILYKYLYNDIKKQINESANRK